MKKVTIKDIAGIAGVDHSTVSRALNDSPRVSPATKERIRSIAEELGFEFNAGGRTLSRGRSGNIAVIYAGNWQVFGSYQYFNVLLGSIRTELEHRHLDAFILEARNPRTGESNIRRLIRQQKVDGFLLAFDRITAEDYRLIEQSGIPVVQLHGRPEFYREEKLNYYFTDNRAGGRMAAEHLIERGCVRIINLTSRNPMDREFGDRFSGYREALEQAGITFNPNLVFPGDCSYQAGYQLVHTHKGQFLEADGIFAQADIVAFGALAALRELGIRVPGDIALVGYDDTPLCTLPIPQITSVHQPVEQMTAAACSRIIDLIETGEAAGDDLEQLELQPRLIERGSTHRG